MQRLCSSAFQRVLTGYRPKTRATLNTHFTTFVQFCTWLEEPLENVTECVVIAFIEYLVQNSLKHSSIVNYISSLKTNFKMYGLSTAPFDHEWVRLALRSIAINVPVPYRVKGVFSIELLGQLVQMCDTLQHGFVYKALFLTATFGFLRLSNLVPSSIMSYDMATHLARGDYLPVASHATLVLKWSKTLQQQGSYATVQLPCLGTSQLCPMKAIEIMAKLLPAGQNDPLFCIPQGTRLLPLTQSKVRKVLQNIVIRLDLCPSAFSFHTFRRTGASLAFNNNVPLEAIKHQGTWSSDSVWTYIHQDHALQNQVSQTFKQLLGSY